MNLKKISKKIGYGILGLITLLGIIAFILQNEKVQSYIIQKIIRYAEKKLHTEISIKKVRLSLTNAIIIEKLLLKDQQKDTLFYVSEINLNFSNWHLHALPELQDLQFDSTYFQLKEDSITGKWNYDFLLNDSSKENTENPLSSLKKITLSHTDFYMENKVQSIKAQTRYVFLNLKDTDIKQKFIDIKALNTSHFSLLYHQKKNTFQPNTTKPKSPEDIKTLIQTSFREIWHIPWNWTITKAAMENIRYTFYNDQQNKYLFSGNIYLKDCQKYTNYLENKITLKQAKINNDLINEAHLSVFIDKKNIKINTLFVANKNTNFTASLHLHYDHLFDKNTNHFWHSLQGEGKINIPRLTMRPFIPYLDSNIRAYLPLNSTFSLLPTKFKFTDSTFSLDSLQVRQNETDFLRTNLRLTFSPNFQTKEWNTDYLHLHINLKDNVQLYKNYTAIVDTNLINHLQYLILEGKGNGFQKKIFGELNLKSAIGNCKTHFNINKTQDSTYIIQTRYESSINDYTPLPNNFSFASLNGTITAQHKNNIFTILNHSTYINNLSYGNHVYKTITLNGNVQENIAQGQLLIDDPAAQINTQYTLDFQNEKAVFLQNESIVQHMDFKQIGLTQNNLKGKYILRTNIYLKKDDSIETTNITGKLELSNLTLNNDYGTYFLDRITCRSTEENDIKHLIIHSQELGKITLQGKYNWATLITSLQNKFYNLFPYNHTSETTIQKTENNFTLIFTLNKFAAFNSLIDANLSKLDTLNAIFSVNDTNTSMRFSVYTNSFRFKQLQCTGMHINVTSNGTQLNVKSTIENLHYSNILYIQNLRINNQNPNRILQIISDKNNCTLNMRMGFTFTPEATRITLYPSSISLRNNVWRNETSSHITISQNTMEMKHLEFVNGIQYIMLEAENKNNRYTTIHTMCKNISISPIQQLLNIPGFSIFGEANLDMYYTSTKNTSPKIQMDYSIKHFILNEDSIGLLSGDLHYDKTQKIYTLNCRTDNPEYDFSVYQKDNKEENENEKTLLNFDLRKVKTHVLHFYTRSFFENIGGYIKGQLRLKEKSGRIFLQGNLALDQGFITVDYTQCTYHINPTTIIFDNEKILFQNIIFKDILHQQGQVNGYIKLPISNLDDMEYEFHVQGTNIIGLNTSSEDNEIFYGRAIGKINLLTKGKGHNDSLRIYIQPGEKTLCNINLGGTGNNNEEKNELKFIHKTAYQDSTRTNKKISLKNPRQKARTTYAIIQKEEVRTKGNFHVFISINKAVKDITAAVIFDRSAQNKISLRGIPNLNFEYDNQKGITMNGKFDISEGLFTLALKELFITKEFTIDTKYNNFINWTGNIENPNLNLKMNYRVERIPFNSLKTIANSSFTLNGTIPTETNNANTGLANGTTGNTTSTPSSAASTANSTSLADVDVSILLTGTPQKMNTDFDINLVNNNSLQNSLVLNNYLQIIRKNPELMRRQVSSVLLLHSFTSQTLGSNNSPPFSITNYANQIISGAISGILFSEFNNSINKLINSNVVKLDINYNSYNTYRMNNNSSNVDLDAIRNQIGFNVHVKITDRLKLTLSPGMDFNLYNSNSGNYINTGASSTVNFLPNANLQYNVTKSGLITLNAFNAANYDNLVHTQRNRTGFSLLISKDFDIKRKKKKEKKDKSSKHKKK